MEKLGLGADRIPLIPAGGDDLCTARIISNLQHMLEHPNVADHHNAPVFRWCYKRMGEFIPQLVRAGRQPRVMLLPSAETQFFLLDDLAQIRFDVDRNGVVTGAVINDDGIEQHGRKLL